MEPIIEFFLWMPKYIFLCPIIGWALTICLFGIMGLFTAINKNGRGLCWVYMTISLYALSVLYHSFL